MKHKGDHALAVLFGINDACTGIMLRQPHHI